MISSSRTHTKHPLLETLKVDAETELGAQDWMPHPLSNRVLKDLLPEMTLMALGGTWEKASFGCHPRRMMSFSLAKEFSPLSGQSWPPTPHLLLLHSSNLVILFACLWTTAHEESSSRVSGDPKMIRH